MSSRYALYFAPGPETPLWRFGCEVLGYDAARGVAVAAVPPAAPDDWHRWTEAPRGYGFHATLKPPFRLRDGVAEPDLLAAAETLAHGLAPVAVPALAVRLLGAFAALVPAAPCPGLDALAAACVVEMDHLRAPLAPQERARRLGGGLPPRETALLDRYGYPYVLDRFRFHMTLTGPLPEEAREPVRAALAARYAALPPGVSVDALAVFAQPEPGAPFRIIARLPLRGTA